MMLSVMIPAYNGEKHIGKALESLVNQTCQDFEVIIVDDGSIDQTSAVAETILSQSQIENYKLLRQVNGGVSSARNAGLKAAAADYVVFLDADDYVSSSLVERVISVCSGKNPDMVCWGLDIVNETNISSSNFLDTFTALNEETSGPEVLKKIILEKSFWIWTGSAAYNRQWLLRHNLLYTQGCANGEDQEFTYKFLSEAKSVRFISDVLAYYVQRAGSISNSFDIKRFDFVNAMTRTGEYLNKLDRQDLNEVVGYITGEAIVNNYIFNYLSCLNNLIFESHFSKRKSIDYLNRELDIKYPEMREAVREHMDRYKGKNIILKLKVRLFQTSLLAYCELGVMKKIIKKFLRRG